MAEGDSKKETAGNPGRPVPEFVWTTVCYEPMAQQIAERCRSELRGVGAETALVSVRRAAEGDSWAVWVPDCAPFAFGALGR